MTATYGVGSGVYMDSRYYAEPTTRFKRGNNLHGASLGQEQHAVPEFFSPRSSLQRSKPAGSSLDMSDSDGAEAMCSTALGNPAATITAIGAWYHLPLA